MLELNCKMCAHCVMKYSSMIIGSLQRFLPAELKVRKAMIMALSEAAHLEVALVESTSQLWIKGNTCHRNISIVSIIG